MILCLSVNDVASWVSVSVLASKWKVNRYGKGSVCSPSTINTSIKGSHELFNMLQNKMSSRLSGSFLDQETSLAEKISSDRMDSLAKIVVAFAPEERQLNMEDIESLQVVSLDGSHLDIEVEVCEIDGCVSMLIPIVFPSPCQSGDDEECLLENIEELQDSASGIVVKRRIKSEEEADWCVSLEGLREPVCNVDAYPTWWIHSGETKQRDMVSECDLLQTLLNSADFKQDMIELASYGIHMERDIELDSDDVRGDFSVLAAIIHSVGPAGLYIRAKIIDEGGQSIVDLPIQFPKVADKSSDIRSCVLGILASIHV